MPAGVYAFDAGKGLSTVSGSPFSPTVSGPIAFSRDSKFLYTIDGTGSLELLAAFSIGSDGSLIPVSGSPFTTPEPLVDLVANPTSDFLYGIGISGALRVFAIDTANGATNLLSSVQVAGGLPTITPDGRYLYLESVSASGGAQISGFAVNANTGALSPVPGGPLALAATEAGPPIIDATGKFLYLADIFQMQVIHACCVYGYAIDSSTGTLTQLPGAPFDVGGSVSSMTISGAFLIAAITPQPPIPAGGACTLAVFSIDPATGALTSVPGSVASQQNCGSVAADSSLPYVYYGVGYESQTGSTIFGYDLDETTGTLNQIETAHVPVTNIGVLAVTH